MEPKLPHDICHHMLTTYDWQAGEPVVQVTLWEVPQLPDYFTLLRARNVCRDWRVSIDGCQRLRGLLFREGFGSAANRTHRRYHPLLRCMPRIYALSFSDRQQLAEMPLFAAQMCSPPAIGLQIHEGGQVIHFKPDLGRPDGLRLSHLLLDAYLCAQAEEVAKKEAKQVKDDGGANSKDEAIDATPESPAQEFMRTLPEDSSETPLRQTSINQQRKEAKKRFALVRTLFRREKAERRTVG